jgi:hypothetical protein
MNRDVANIIAQFKPRIIFDRSKERKNTSLFCSTLVSFLFLQITKCKTQFGIIKLIKVRTKICFLKINIFISDKIKDFLNEFEIDTADGYKASKYVKQLVI